MKKQKDTGKPNTNVTSQYTIRIYEFIIKWMAYLPSTCF